MSQELLSDKTAAERADMWTWFYSALPRPTHDLRVWDLIKAHPGITVAQLAAQAGLEGHQISKSVQRLHKRDLINRMSGDRANRFRYWSACAEVQA